MRAAEIFFLARVTLAAIVGSGTRKAWAISVVVSPQTSRKVSATWASRARAGWQQVNTRRSRSSGITSSSPGAGAGGDEPATGGTGSTSSGSLPRRVRLAPQRVDGAPPGGGGQPGGGIAGHALPGPCVQGGHIGVLNAFLGEIDVAGHARRRGEHEGPLATVRVGDGDGGAVGARLSLSPVVPGRGRPSSPASGFPPTVLRSRALMSPTRRP